MFVNTLLSSTYISSGNQKIIAKVSAFAALFNVGLNLILIPLFASVGAALATVATEFIVMIFGIYWITKNILHRYLFNEIFFPLIAAFLLVIYLLFFGTYINLLLLYSLSIFIFLGILHVTGWLNSEDKQLFRKVILYKR
ncbi:hypothetical protein DU80_19865 [Methanosarcina mazei]|nr:polysaccharide biosynthesis C-terminal domain-containing protein [Methanosarcina mazei]KKH84523.1 hypothetical protein DU80_19865 [Methanosarcina mazei]